MKIIALADWANRWQSVISRITLIESEMEVETCLDNLSMQDSSQIVAYVNAHAMNLVATSDEFAQNLKSANLIFRDGAGMALLLTMVGKSPGLNLNGTDLIPRIIKKFDGKKIALFGTEEPYISQARLKILESIAPNAEIIIQNGFKGNDVYLNLANEFAPDLIVFGMGMPRQEILANRLSSQLKKPAVMVCGGAIIDFLGGKVQRAPAWMQKFGVEWLFRLLSEPRRLFTRYVVGNPLFIFRANRYKSYNKFS